MGAADRLDALAAQAEYLLQQMRALPVRVHTPVLLTARSRSVVLRCSVTGWPGVPTVVLKQPTGDDARAYTDWASLAFLSDLPAAHGIAPRLIVADRATRLLVLEDLSGSRSLADVLDASDTATVVRVLQALARPMALLVTATSGREADYQQRRAAFPGANDMGRAAEARQWLAGRQRLERWARALALRLPPRFDHALQQVAAVYANPGPWLAFTHGDPAPSNNHVQADHVRLLDFEYGGYRHALYDLTAWYVLCPLPPAWYAALEGSFRQAFGRTGVGALIHDGDRYHAAWATLCAYRALAMLTWFPLDLLQQDRPWTPGWTMRAALSSTARRLVVATARVTPLAPLTAFGTALAKAVQDRWPEVGTGELRWPGVTDAP